jgi:hypothetical protein
MTTTNHALGRDAFFAACAEKASQISDIEPVDCEELGGKVYVKILTPDMVELADRNAKGSYDRAIYMVLFSIVDENGQQMFENREEVGKLKLPIFNALSKCVGKANKEESVEKISKN